MSNAPKRSPGRPRLSSATRGPSLTINTRYPDEMVAAIDEIIAARMDKPDRSAVIRELVAEALEARRQRR